MPARNNFEYTRPIGLLNGHMETIYPALFRKITDLPKIRRERITTPDHDFLDLEWYEQHASSIVILQHGLEGSANRPYMQGMASCFFQSGFDALCWNYRSCGNEMNLQKRMYHSGATDDLQTIVKLVEPNYDNIYLVGFSLGGNLTLKYLGEKQRSTKVKKAVAISTPLDLYNGVKHMHTSQGWIYEKRFLKNLIKKARIKENQFPGLINLNELKKIKTLLDFDDTITAPIHGYDGAKDYYEKCASKNFLSGIEVPTLILNALNDPILTSQSLDHGRFSHLDNVLLETTLHGGHVGFAEKDPKGRYWSEKRAVGFCLEKLE